MITKKRVGGSFLSVFLAGYFFFSPFKLSAQDYSPYHSIKPNNPDKFDKPIEDTLRLNQRLEILCQDLYSTDSDFNRYFDKTQYVPLKINEDEYIRVHTKVDYNKKNVRVLVGIDERNIRENLQIDDVYLWLVSTTKENASSQKCLILDRNRKTVEISPIGEEVCKGEYCENLFSAGDRMIFYVSKKLGFTRQEDITLILRSLDFRVATRARSEAYAIELQNITKGRTYLSHIKNKNPPISMMTNREYKAYEIIINIAGSEPYGLVILSYASKIKGIAGYQTNPCLNVIHFNFNLQNK